MSEFQSNEKDAILLALKTALIGRCTTCGRPRATSEDWDTTNGGERPDLCWDYTPESCVWSGMVDLDEVRADAVLRVLSPGLERGDE